tara:strand:+ start:216 stop:503 length:288 start_codon:yes stop_codon:yes gene_type:complete
MTKKAILIQDIERSLLDTIFLSEPWWPLEKGFNIYTEENIKHTDNHYAKYKKLCKEHPGDYMEITLTDEEYNRIVKYKQETLALDLILSKLCDNK